MIQLITSNPILKPLCLVLGNFDGIHRGHQSLLAKAREIAKASSCEPALMRLDPHPRQFFSPMKKVELIQNHEQTIHLLAYYGVSHLLSFPFNQRTSRFSPEQFVDFMLENLQVEHLVVGRNYRFGWQRSGQPEMLRHLAAPRNIAVYECDDICDSSGVISSTRVRDCIRRGDVAEAQRLLGRPYFMEGIVVSDLKKGREMGTPTANIEPSNSFLPLSGVYATWLNSKGSWYPSITHIGERPTRLEPQLGIETHVIGTDLDLYNQHIFLVFCSFLRGERIFDSFADLRNQIQKDIEIRKGQPDYERTPDLSMIDALIRNWNPKV